MTQHFAQHINDLEFKVDNSLIAVEVVAINYHSANAETAYVRPERGAGETLEDYSARLDSFTPISFNGAYLPGDGRAEVYLDDIAILQGKFTTGSVVYEALDGRLNDGLYPLDSNNEFTGSRQWSLDNIEYVVDSDGNLTGAVKDMHISQPGDLLLVYVHGGDLLNSAKYALGAFPSWEFNQRDIDKGYPKIEASPSDLHSDIHAQIRGAINTQIEIADLSPPPFIISLRSNSDGYKIINKVGNDIAYRGSTQRRKGSIVNTYIERDDDGRITDFSADIIGANKKITIIRRLEYHTNNAVSRVNQSIYAQTPLQIYQAVAEVLYSENGLSQTSSYRESRLSPFG